jgi:pimeloyl-ACP methyl ester carboxylesterase
VISAKGLSALGALIAVLMVSSCTASGSPEATSKPGVEDHFEAFGPCVDLPAIYVCATIQVPLDRDDDSAGTIPLRIFGIPHNDMSAPEGLPWFAIPGGPGSSGVWNQALANVPAMIRAHHDVVAIDPRGTGKSAPIDCQELQAGSTPLTREQVAHDTTACGQHLGAASNLYGSAARAMDAEAVREFMGYDQVILHGTSNGGVDVQAYASRFPDRLAAAVIDGGIVMDSLDAFFGTDVAAGTIGVVNTACRADAVCAASTDDPAGTVSAVVHRLSEGPVTDNGVVVIDEASIARLIREAGAAVEVVAASLAFLAGDTAPLAELVSENFALEVPPAGDIEEFSAGANAAGWCNDQAYPFEITASQTERQEQLDEAVAELDDDAFAPWSKQGWREFWLFDQCVGWPTPRHPEPVLSEKALSSGIPTLLLVGDEDPAIASVEALASRFPDSTTVVVPGVGHPSITRGPCVARFVADFIETLVIPTTPPCSAP